MSGWIKLHRKFLDWEWYDDHNTTRLFTYILIAANYEPKKWHGIPIARGQFLTSVSKLSEKTGLSIKSVRTSLNKLKSTSEVASQTTSLYTMLTIVRYEEYQDLDCEGASQRASEVANQGQTKGKPRATTKELKNLKNLRTKENKEAFPDWLPMEDWEAFLEMRKSMKAKPTDNAIKLLINDLTKKYNNGQNVSEIIQKSTMNNWKGFYDGTDKRASKQSTGKAIHGNFGEQDYTEGTEGFL